MSQQTQSRKNAINRLFKEQNGACWLCGKLMLLKQREVLSITLDHAKPRSHFLPEDIHRGENLKGAHWICNQVRGDRLGKLFVTEVEKIKFLSTSTHHAFRNAEIPLVLLGRMPGPLKAKGHEKTT